MKKKGKGRLFVVSAPSGAGKTTVVKGAIKKLPFTRLSVSWTTRKPRRGEKNGVDYTFVSKNEFESLIKKKGLLEWAKVFGQYYGTPMVNLKLAKRDDFDLFLIIDVQGGAQVRRRVKGAILIFVLPPSMRVLEERLEKRGKETREEIAKRLKKSNWEISQASNYDYAIVNDKLKVAISELVDIVNNERKICHHERTK